MPSHACIHLRQGSQARGEGSGFGLVLLHRTLPRSLGCGRPLCSALPLLPTSLPAGLQQGTVQAPSTLPVLPGTQRVRCSLAAHIRVCACLCRVWGVQGCAGCRDSPGCPSVNHQGFLLLHFMNSLLCFFLSKR